MESRTTRRTRRSRDYGPFQESPGDASQTSRLGTLRAQHHRALGLTERSLKLSLSCSAPIALLVEGDWLCRHRLAVQTVEHADLCYGPPTQLVRGALSVLGSSLCIPSFSTPLVQTITPSISHLVKQVSVFGPLADTHNTDHPQ